MSTRITCPGCGRSLSLPDDYTAGTQTCPRCLTRIHNPQARATTTVVQTGGPANPPPSAASTGVTKRNPWTRGVDVDVRRDSRRTSACLIALAVLGWIGVSWALLGGIVAVSEGGLAVLYAILVCLLVLAVSSAIWVYVRHSGETPGFNIGQMMLGVLTISGVVLLLAAALNLLFVVCKANPSQFH